MDSRKIDDGLNLFSLDEEQSNPCSKALKAG